MGFWSHVASKPYISLLAVSVAAGVGGGVWLASRFLATDPTIVLKNKKENPYPWLSLPQNTNLKLYAVNNKFDEQGVRKTYVSDE